MPCIFLKDGQCNNPNRNLDFECNFDLPSDCSDGLGDHIIEIRDNIVGTAQLNIKKIIVKEEIKNGN